MSKTWYVSFHDEAHQSNTQDVMSFPRFETHFADEADLLVEVQRVFTCLEEQGSGDGGWHTGTPWNLPCGDGTWGLPDGGSSAAPSPPHAAGGAGPHRDSLNPGAESRCTHRRNPLRSPKWGSLEVPGCAASS